MGSILSLWRGLMDLFPAPPPRFDYSDVMRSMSEGWTVPQGFVHAVKVQSATPSDAVHRPLHYARFLIEPMTFIAANKLPFLVGNVIKYVCRFDAKNGDEDLRKAIRCIEMLLEQREREREGSVADKLATPL